MSHLTNNSTFIIWYKIKLLLHYLIYHVHFSRKQVMNMRKTMMSRMSQLLRERLSKLIEGSVKTDALLIRLRNDDYKTERVL